MTHTLREILSQPTAWQSALAQAKQFLPDFRSLLGDKPTSLLFVGCGSTYYLAQTAASLFRRLTGLSATALPGGEMFLYGEEWLGKWNTVQSRPLLIAISRSGATTETIRVVEAHRAVGGRALAVTTRPDSPLASLTDLALVLPEGQEESVVQTRSFTSMLVALNALAALLGENAPLWEAMQRLPEVGERLIQMYQPQARTLGEDFSLDRFYFLGSGLRYGLACEASLKMKELSLSHSEPFPFLEFRHGPMSMVNGQTCLIGLLSERRRSYEQSVLDEMQALGARTLSLAERAADVAFASEIPEEGRGALFLPVLQLIATYRALAKGLNPDRPNNLNAVVILRDIP